MEGLTFADAKRMLGTILANEMVFLIRGLFGQALKTSADRCMEDLERGQPETCQPEFCADRECLCGKPWHGRLPVTFVFSVNSKKPDVV